MADKLNYEVVEEKLSSFNTSCDSLYSALKEMDEIVSASVSVSGGAIYGNLGKKLLRDWDNNCSRFLNFKGVFDDWRSAAIDIVKINDEFEQEAVAATEEVYNKSDLPFASHEESVSSDNVSSIVGGAE